MQVNYYHSAELSTDPEGDLVQLCADHAREHGATFASRGDAESECEICDRANDPDRARHLDALVAAL